MNDRAAYLASLYDRAADERLPEVLDLEPTHNCNLRCVMCHVPHEVLTRAALPLDRLRTSLSDPRWHGRWAVVGATHEPMSHPDFPELVRCLTEAGLKIDLTTNGTLLTDRMIDQIVGGSFAVVTVSFDGARPETYERIRVGADFERTIDRIAAFRRAVGNERTYWAVNYTALRTNIDEIDAALTLWDRIGFDHLGIIAMNRRSDHPALDDKVIEPVIDHLRATVFAVARRVVDDRLRISISSSLLTGTELAVVGNVAISDHPDAVFPLNCRPHYQAGYHPDVPVACRSPYTYVRVDYHGAIRLCHKFPIGDLTDTTVLDAWNGELATAHRASVRDDPAICGSCDYYRFCVRAGELDPLR